MKIVNWLNEKTDICFHSKEFDDTKITNAKSEGDTFNLANFIAI